MSRHPASRRCQEAAPEQTVTAQGEEYPVCRRCNRRAVGWPVYRGDRCSPRDWWRCIRDPLVVMAENEPA